MGNDGDNHGGNDTGSTDDARGLTSRLLWKARAGDDESLGHALARLKPFLMRQARMRVKPIMRPVVDPEDLYLHAVAASLAKLNKVSPRDGHLTSVVRKYVVKAIKSRAKDILDALFRRHPITRAEVQADTASIPADTLGIITRLGQAEENSALHKALDLLKPIDQEILVLCALEEEPTREVAKITGLSVSAVKKRYERARKRLKMQLPASLIEDMGL